MWYCTGRKNQRKETNMTYLILSFLFITGTALICFLFINLQFNKERISTRAFIPLCVSGACSWVVQIYLLWHLPEQAAEIAFVCILLAMFCCTLLLYGHHQAIFSTSAVAQALLWGIFVFPTVLLVVLLISLLPEGINTLFAVLGFI